MDATASKKRRLAFWCVAGLLSLVSAHCGDQAVGTSIQHVEAVIESNCKDQNTYIWTGDLIVENITVPGSTPSEGSTITLSLGSLQDITENLEFVDIRLEDGVGGSWTVDTGSLTEIGGNLSFSKLQGLTMPLLSNLQRTQILSFNDVEFMPAFTDLDYTVKWPELSAVTTMGLIDTSLSKFGPFQLSLSPYNGSPEAWITVTGNEQLTNLEINGYGNAGVFAHVNIHDNAASPSVSFPLMTEGSFNISSVSSLSVPGVQTLGSQILEFETQTISSNSFTTLDLSNVSTASGIVEIDSNPSLKSLDLANLNTVTSLKITNNTQLDTINLGSLFTIQKSLEIEGPINTLTVPSGFENAVGSISINTWGTLDCTSLNLNASQCQTVSAPKNFGEGPTGSGSGNNSNPTDSSGGGDQNSGGGGGGLSKGAQIGIGVGVGVGGLLIIGAIIFICYARRRKQRQRISPRSAGANEYYLEPKNHERSPARYTKVANSGSVDHGSVDRSSEERVSPSSHFAESHLGESRFDESRFGENWSPPEQRVPTTDGRIELEEQQGPRHEMDARSLQDMDLDDDREETRSLEDIERAHGQT